MVIEDGKFYFIKDEFFDVFKDYGLMENKDGGIKRLYGLFQYLLNMKSTRKFMIIRN